MSKCCPIPAVAFAVERFMIAITHMILAGFIITGAWRARGILNDLVQVAWAKEPRYARSEPKAFATISKWHGFTRFDFVVDGRGCVLILPETSAQGRPWIWRMEFFDHEPQADLALLQNGFHVAYMDVRNMYGAPIALDHMDKFYELLRRSYELAPRGVLEGFSRGGLFALNWAARHPERVASLYLDAPVCDFKSWPGGKGGGKCSPIGWDDCKKAYELSEEQAMSYALNPVDNLKALALAKIPILSVCGDADETVLFNENTAVLAKRYVALGGEIKVILKPGVGHHPHSLKDPGPIVEFILRHSRY